MFESYCCSILVLVLYLYEFYLFLNRTVLYWLLKYIFNYFLWIKCTSNRYIEKKYQEYTVGTKIYIIISSGI